MALNLLWMNFRIHRTVKCIIILFRGCLVGHHRPPRHSFSGHIKGNRCLVATYSLTCHKEISLYLPVFLPLVWRWFLVSKLWRRHTCGLARCGLQPKRLLLTQVDGAWAQPLGIMPGRVHPRELFHHTRLLWSSGMNARSSFLPPPILSHCYQSHNGRTEGIRSPLNISPNYCFCLLGF